jgi:hypothetical protein
VVGVSKGPGLPFWVLVRGERSEIDNENDKIRAKSKLSAMVIVWCMSSLRVLRERGIRGFMEWIYCHSIGASPEELSVKSMRDER